MLDEKRLYTYACVADQYAAECGEAGVLEFFGSSFADCVKANGCYAPRLASWRALSSKEVKVIGLTRHPQATWFLLEGTAIQGHLVSASVH
jgi:hypothetical protein